MPFCDSHLRSQNCAARRSDRAHARGILLRRSLPSSSPPPEPRVGKRGTLGRSLTPKLGKMRAAADQLPPDQLPPEKDSKTSERERVSRPRSCGAVGLSTDRGRTGRSPLLLAAFSRLLFALLLRASGAECVTGKCALVCFGVVFVFSSSSLESSLSLGP